MEIDYVLYSKCNFQFDKDSPLITQRKYNKEKSYYYTKFEIKENVLQFFELKSSYYIFGDREFYGLLNKCQEFVYLYESRGWIDKKTKKEIILIYDSELTDKISLEHEKEIKKFIQNNNEFSFSVVFSISSFAFFSHKSAINKYWEVKSQIEESKRNLKKVKKKLVI